MELKRLTRKLTAAACSLLAAAHMILPAQALDPYPDIVEGTASDYVYIFDYESGQVLSEKNSEERMYPASMTKIVTAIVAIEKLPDLDRNVTITAEMLAGLREANASVAGFAEDDTVTVRDLLYGVALPSGADAANALAYECAGGIDAYVELMNQKAAELGLTETHFSNTTGLHEDDHYSTAREFAEILAYCVENETFREIFSTARYVSTPTQWYPQGIEMLSTTVSPAKNLGISLDGLIGSKTGFTWEAGHCLAWWAEINDMKIVGINAHADEDSMYASGHLTDAARILSNLHNYEKVTITQPGNCLDTVIIHYSDHDDTVDIFSDQSVVWDLPRIEDTKLTSTLPEEVTAGLEPYEVTGVITITRNGLTLFNEGISITVPAERKFTVRIRLYWDKLFHKDSGD